MKMKARVFIFSLALTGSLPVLFFGCAEVEKGPGELPVLITRDVYSVSPTSANSGGEITSDGGSEITERGICWNTLPNPTRYDNKTLDGSGAGYFKSSLTGLTTTTTYYVRSFATNRAGTGYGNEISFRTYTGIVADVDGNIYNTMTIGSQNWMAENLKTTKYSDNTIIPLVADIAAWSVLSTPAYCWYEDDSIKNSAIGALYNWYAVNEATNGGKNVCPAGWHVPTDTDWLKLTTFLGGESVAGGKMKESGITHWLKPNTGASNESGFSGLPGGGRYHNGRFKGLGTRAGWWSSSELLSTSGRGRYLYYEYSMVYRGSGSKRDGFSVRCIRD
jgi:uncharacterized protein (TIGR02145 family)